MGTMRAPGRNLGFLVAESVGFDAYSNAGDRHKTDRNHRSWGACINIFGVYLQGRRASVRPYHLWRKTE